jgi:hypothetical protein
MRGFSSLLLLASLPSASAVAEVAKAPAPTQVHFAAPEILKLDWNTRCPRVADFNGDKLPDLAVINQDRSRIELLLQSPAGVKPGEAAATSRTEIWNPILEVSRFQKQPLVVGSSMFSLAVGDWNGDGRADLAYTTDDSKLVLRTRGTEAGDWTQKKEFMLDSTSSEADTLIATDLNADGKADLAVLTQTRLVIYRQAAPGEWQDPLTYSLSSKGHSALAAADLNADGKLDLVSTPGDGGSVSIRLQSKDGGFGQEWSMEIPMSKSWVKPIRLCKGNALTWIQDATGMAEVAQFQTATSAAEVDMAASIRYAIPPSESKTGATCFGDITGDGIGDVIIAEAKAARVWLFQGQKDSTFGDGKEYPCLSAVEAMTMGDTDGDGKPELIVLSPTEKTLAAAKWTGTRLDYPQTLHQSADPLLGLALGRFGNRKDNVLVCVVDKKPKAQLLVLQRDAAKKQWTASNVELTSPPTKISGLTLLDANNDSRGDVVLFSGLSPLQILLSNADEKKPLIKVEGLPDNLTTKISATALSAVDFDADGSKELLIAKEQFARLIKISAEGKATVSEQFNAPSASAQLSGAIVTGAKDLALRRVTLIDAGQGKLHQLRADKDGVLRSFHSRKLSAGSWDDARLVGPPEAEKLVLLSKQSFEVIPLTGSTQTLQRLATFTSELKDTTMTEIIPAGLQPNGPDDLLLLDAKKTRVLEFFRSTSPEQRSWQSYMYFRVFQSDPNYRGKAGYDYEPHDSITADLNGDGRADLCLLAHDRLLIYVQK